MYNFTYCLSSFWSEINNLDVSLTNAIFRLLLSMVLGMCIGYERKRKGQIAGIRTFALMAMGACMAMLLSIYVPQVYLGLKNGDPSRIAAQVITGVGFIGCGAMIQTKGAVRGLTTAAGIWITAIIGMAVGVGMYLCAIIATIISMVILVTIEWYEQTRHIGQENKVLNVTVNEILTDLSPYEQLFSQHHMHLSSYYIEYDYEACQTIINFVVLIPTRSNILPIISQLRELGQTKSITLSSQIEL